MAPALFSSRFRPFRSSGPDESAAPQPGGPLIRMRDVEKSYPAGTGKVYVLRHLDLEIQPGEFVSVMGPSGAGTGPLVSRSSSES